MTQANKKGWEFLLVGVLIASTLVFGCSPMQKTRVYRIGVLLSGDIRLEAFSGLKDGLRDLGYVEGENVTFEVMNAKGDRSLLPELARSIGDREPDVAVAGGGQMLEQEFERRFRTAWDLGRYTPCLDHGAPPDISWKNARQYARLFLSWCESPEGPGAPVEDTDAQLGAGADTEGGAA